MTIGYFKGQSLSIAPIVQKLMYANVGWRIIAAWAYSLNMASKKETREIHYWDFYIF